MKWETRALGKVCEIVPGRHILETNHNRARRGIPYLTGPSDFGLLQATASRWTEKPEVMCKPRDILVTVKGAGVASLNFAPDEPACIGRQLMAVRAREGVSNADFIYVALKSLTEELRAKSMGATVPGLSIEHLAKLPIPLVPFPEQKRIAARLREQLAEVEKAREALLSQLEAAEKLEATHLRDVFLANEVRASSRLPFERMAVLQRGHDLPATQRTQGCYPVVTSAGIVGTHSAFIARGPGVVTGRSGSVGKVHFITEDYWPHNTALYVKDFKGNEPRFIYHLMRWIGVRDVSSGTGVPTLDRKEVHKLEVPALSLSQQRSLIEKVDEAEGPIRELIGRIKARLEAVEKLPAAMLREVFSDMSNP